MSVAFVKEESAEAAAETLLPERPISSHPNLVTAHGLKALQAALEAAREAAEVATRIDDINERRRQSASPLRDLRYFAERLKTAILMPEPDSTDTVAFGNRVTFRRSDGRVATYRIVGEDEADPRDGTLSYVSPIARLLMGRQVGDTAVMGQQEIEIIAIA